MEHVDRTSRYVHPRLIVSMVPPPPRMFDADLSPKPQRTRHSYIRQNCVLSCLSHALNSKNTSVMSNLPRCWRNGQRKRRKRAKIFNFKSDLQNGLKAATTTTMTVQNRKRKGRRMDNWSLYWGVYSSYDRSLVSVSVQIVQFSLVTHGPVGMSRSLNPEKCENCV